MRLRAGAFVAAVRGECRLFPSSFPALGISCRPKQLLAAIRHASIDVLILPPIEQPDHDELCQSSESWPMRLSAKQLLEVLDEPDLNA